MADHIGVVRQGAFQERYVHGGFSLADNRIYGMIGLKGDCL
jgi:hypothetical protein